MRIRLRATSRTFEGSRGGSGWWPPLPPGLEARRRGGGVRLGRGAGVGLRGGGGLAPSGPGEVGREEHPPRPVQARRHGK